MNSSEAPGPTVIKDLSILKRISESENRRVRVHSALRTFRLSMYWLRIFSEALEDPG
jgi:hypothetical protein